jgi:hypothetical protein
MAEVAASIIGISTFGIKLTLTLYEFSSTTSHAREEIDSIAKHVTLYANVLELLAERLEADEPLISEAAFDLVEELYEQSEELFESIRKLLPRRDGQGDFSFIQRLTWNFKKTKVEKLVGTLEYLKSTVQLLITVIFTGKKIGSYRWDCMLFSQIVLIYQQETQSQCRGREVQSGSGRSQYSMHQNSGCHH